MPVMVPTIADFEANNLSFQDFHNFVMSLREEENVEQVCKEFWERYPKND